MGAWRHQPLLWQPARPRRLKGQNLLRSPQFCTFKTPCARAALPARPRALPAHRTGGGTSRGIGAAIRAVGAGSSGRNRRLRRAPRAHKSDAPDHQSEPNFPSRADRGVLATGCRARDEQKPPIISHAARLLCPLAARIRARVNAQPPAQPIDLRPISMTVFADLVPYTPGRDRRIANQIRCRPTEGHSDALGWKDLRGEADATNQSQHQLRVKGVDKRRERGSAGEPLRSSRTAVPGTARPGRASDRVRRRRTGAAAGGRGKEKCRGCSGPAACRWAPRAERTLHPRQSPWACARAPHRAA